jgi:hypothetical protein
VKANTGITLTGGKVSQADDQSGNARHLVQSTDANRMTTASFGGNTVLIGSADTFLSGEFPASASYSKIALVNLINLDSYGGNLISQNNKHAMWYDSNTSPVWQAGHNGTFNSAINGSVPVVINTWYHIAVTYNQSTTTMKLYVNGSLVDTDTSVASQDSAVALLNGYASNLYGGNARYLEAGVWGVVLTDSEITADKNRCASDYSIIL